VQIAGGFDFTTAMRSVAADMIERLPDLAHIDLTRICVAFTQARKAGPHGLQASLTPLRFPKGAREGIKRGRRYRVQEVYDQEQREMLYILTFCLPRFMDLDFREKLITVLHELWHISPDFDGDIRRHAGRCYAHTHSQKEYDAEMGRLADTWLAQSPPESLYLFLQQDFAGLWHLHGGLFGTRVSRPRLIPV
jgi:hypothetical protein